MASEDDGFDFIKEKIKERPIDKKKVLMRIGGTIGLALVFGVVACCTFYVVKPWAEARFTPEVKPDPIVLPKDEESDEQTESEEEHTAKESSTEPESTEPETTIIRETVELGIEDLEKLDREITQVANKAMNSIVTVTGVTQVTDMLNEPSEKYIGEASGLIIVEHEEALFIVTEYRVIKGAETIRVTFSDGTTVDASSLKYDGNTEFAVVRVPLEGVNEITRSKIVTDALNTRATVQQGDTVIALGSSNSFVRGMVTSISNSYTVTEQSDTATYDTDYNLLNTDIYGSSGGSDVLINLKGQVVGIISQKFSVDSARGLTGLSISQLAQLVVDLSNNRDIPYLGIKAIEVTEVTAAANSTPTGLYIKSIAQDSPAEQAGLQCNDFIVSINGQEVLTLTAYKNILSQLAVGQDVVIGVKREQGVGEEYKDIPFTTTVGFWSLE